LHDLLIIGGGPAGSSAAYQASRMGLSVLLIEKEAFPRYKPCGGAFSELCISALPNGLPSSIPSVEISKVVVCFAGQRAMRDKGRRLATLVDRGQFDHFLLEEARAAGAEIVTGCRAKAFLEHIDHVSVTVDGAVHKARFAAICTGALGRLDLPDVNRPRSDQGICLVTEIPYAKKEESGSSSKLANEAVHPRDAIEIHFGVANMGYGWVFPHKDHFSVGIGGLASELRQPRAVMSEFVRSNGFYGSPKVRGHGIPLGGPIRRFACKRWLLAGDAAGFVDPFTGEGIAYAVSSGRLAALAAAQALSGGELSGYERACLEQFGADLKAARLLARIMHRFPQKLFGAFLEHPNLIDQYLEIPATNLDYRGFLRKLLLRIPELMF
jgi:geranylgeranyl reductase family protein